MFRFGKPWGAGLKIYPSGKEKIGYWDQDKFIENMPTEQQFQTFNDILKADNETFDFKQMAVSFMNQNKKIENNDDVDIESLNIA